MVRKNTLKIKLFSSLAIVLLSTSLLILPLVAEHQSLAACTTAANGNVSCTSSTTFNIGVNEILTVSITRPASWAHGGINTFLTNKVGVSIISNNPDGFTATMKSATEIPNLVNLADDASIIPTLAGQVDLVDSSSDMTHEFPANRWGYGIVGGNASAPSSYFPMSGSEGTPITIASTTVASGTVAKDIYFAAKADSTMASGTYANEVVISVVAGVNGEAVNPVTPGDDIANDGVGTEVASGNTAHGTVVTTTTEDETTTTESYAKPAGATERTAAVINEGTPLATGLAITAGIAAVAGIIFFIIAKRRRNDDEDDEF